jgi:hypothetical protein
MKKIVILFILIFLIQPTYAFWSNSINGNSAAENTTVLIGTWNQFILPLDPDTEYEEGDQFIYDDQIWTVVDVDDPVGDEQTRLFVIIPGEGLVLVAITDGGNGNTIVVRIND